MEDGIADWLTQARQDISSAENTMASGSYEWACFIAQQGAEKAVNALYQKLQVVPYGHDVAELLRALINRVLIPDEVMADARALDRYYNHRRYPDKYSEAAPGDHFTMHDANEAIGCGKRILQFCESESGPRKRLLEA